MCDDCKIGMYQPSIGQKDCLNCEAGRFAVVQGANACDTCLPGKYHDKSDSDKISAASKWTTTGIRDALNKLQANIWRDMIEMRDHNAPGGTV